jgi:predicted esterase
MKTASGVVVLAVALAAGAQAQSQARSAALDHAFERFWKAGSRQAARRAVPALVESGADFAELHARLRADRPLALRPKTGELSFTAMLSDGRGRPYTVVVPDDLAAGEELPVRFQLHGGVNRPAPEEGEPLRPGRRRNLEAQREILVFPSADREAPWWGEEQVESLSTILDRLKRAYRIDNNRVYLTGVSDGATGAYYVAQRDTTPWASFLPLIGQPLVLTNPSVGVEGDFYVRNLANKPWFLVNGGRDPLYPAAAVVPIVDLLRRAGVSLEFRPQPEAGHDLSWWPKLREEFAAFVKTHPRDPLPDFVTWETERPERFGRAHWLVIETLGAAAGEATFDDFDAVASLGPRDFGLRVEPQRPGAPRVRDVIKGSDAHALGLERGDVVLELNGRALARADELWQALQGYALGTPLRAAALRKGRRVALETVLQPSGSERVFKRTRPSGRVELQRKGNLVEVRTRGVRRFKLLLSPDEFDFDQPVVVTVNGRPSFEGRVQRSVATLLDWAARDNDRTLLFGAELRLEVPAR